MENFILENTYNGNAWSRFTNKNSENIHIFHTINYYINTLLYKLPVIPLSLPQKAPSLPATIFLNPYPTLPIPPVGQTLGFFISSLTNTP